MSNINSQTKAIALLPDNMVTQVGLMAASRTLRTRALTVVVVLLWLFLLNNPQYFQWKKLRTPPAASTAKRVTQEQDLARERKRKQRFEKKVKSAVQLMDGMSLYDVILKSITVPPPHKRRFGVPSEDNLLSLAIIETRKTDYLAPVIYNMAHVYGNTSACLYLFHGTKNEAYVRDITHNWENVQYVNLGVEHLPWPSGPNDVLISEDFYRNFTSEFVLTFQIDSLIRRQIDEDFFKYDYVGGPWHERIIKMREEYEEMHVTSERRIGNGGFSLRRVSTMIEIARIPKPASWVTPWEDQWISKNLEEGHFPSVEDAMRFSVDSMYYPDPVGIHKIYGWDTITFEDAVRVLANIPGAEVLRFDDDDDDDNEDED